MPSNRYSCINAASLDLRTQVARNKKPRQCLLNRLDLDEYILNCNGIKRNKKQKNTKFVSPKICAELWGEI